MAGWADKFKKETILVQQEDNHNKFWAAYVNETTKTAHVRWGRLGTKGQSQEKTFGSIYDAAGFVDSKMREKNRKGYKTIDQTKFDKLSVEAAIVGAQNKCDDLQWVEITDERNLVFKPCDESRLQDPNCNPGIRVNIETKKSYGGSNRFKLLFTFTRAFELVGSGPRLITKASPIYELTAKVEEAIGRTLSS